jgi:hypothetical protein
MDDEQVTYKAYELCVKHGIKNVCGGLFPSSIEEKFPHLLAYSDVRDVGKAAKDWPQLNSSSIPPPTAMPAAAAADGGVRADRSHLLLTTR